MKLIQLKGQNDTIVVSQSVNEIQVVKFDSKFNNKIQEFVDTLSDKEFDGIILPASIEGDNFIGFEICLRIRLSKKLGAKSLVSIFLNITGTSESIYKNQIEKKDNPSSSILFTKGVFTFQDADDLLFLINNHANYNILNKENFKEWFLDIIQIKKSPEFGNHTIANIWGVHQLANIAGILNELEKFISANEKLKELQSDLYFKYLTALNDEQKTNSVKQITIPSKDKNILLIDDEENKGWTEILKLIFLDAKFESVKSGDDFINRAKVSALEKVNGLPKWDLILLDLRLDDKEDQGANAYKTASEYSGAKLLKEIKADNQGTQVIMFTASNKAWNMRELMEMGADGFYIKESPEYNQDVAFSKKNFESFEIQVLNTFQKAFLRNIFIKLSPLLTLCKLELNRSHSKRKLSLTFQLIEKADDQFFIFSKLINDFPLELKWAFTPLILLIEEIVNVYYFEDNSDQVIEMDSFTKHRCIFNIGSDRFLALTPQYIKADNKLIYFLANHKISSEDDKSKYLKPIKFIPFNYRLACLLHFRYLTPLDNSLFRFFDLYKIRSESVAHAGGIGKIKPVDVELAIDLLTLLIK